MKLPEATAEREDLLTLTHGVRRASPWPVGSGLWEGLHHGQGVGLAQTFYLMVAGEEKDRKGWVITFPQGHIPSESSPFYQIPPLEGFPPSCNEDEAFVIVTNNRY